MFDFSQDDLRGNKEGRISARQKEWLDKLGSTTVKWGGVTFWIAIAFVPIFAIFILALFLINENTRTLMRASFPMLAATLCIVVVAIFVFSFLGIKRARSQAAEIAKVELLVAEGIARLGETRSPRWGTGYFLDIGETRFAIDARDKFQEGQRYRVYYGRVSSWNLILSYERIS